MPIINKRSIIITLKIDNASQLFFDSQRKLYFPAYANFTCAHLTMFHKLPSNEILIKAALQQLSSIDTFEMQVTNIKNIGNFIAYEISSPTLQAIHQKLQIAFTHWLLLKDRQPLWPHITIQNKATDYKAMKTHQKLMETFAPFPIQAIGFTSWFYTKNKWEKEADYFFN